MRASGRGLVVGGSRQVRELFQGMGLYRSIGLLRGTGFALRVSRVVSRDWLSIGNQSKYDLLALTRDRVVNAGVFQGQRHISTTRSRTMTFNGDFTSRNFSKSGSDETSSSASPFETEDVSVQSNDKPELTPEQKQRKIDKEYGIKYSLSGLRKPFELPPKGNRKRNQRWKVSLPKVVIARELQFQYSVRKMNMILRLIRRLSVDEALKQVSVLFKKGSPVVKSLIEKARATAINDKKLNPDRLIIDRAWVTKGVYLKRIRYHGKGYHGIKKRYYSHTTIMVRELDEVEWNEKVASSYEFKRYKPLNKFPTSMQYNLPKTWLIRTQIDASSTLPIATN